MQYEGMFLKMILMPMFIELCIALHDGDELVTCIEAIQRLKSIASCEDKPGHVVPRLKMHVEQVKTCSELIARYSKRQYKVEDCAAAEKNLIYRIDNDFYNWTTAWTACADVVGGTLARIDEFAEFNIVNALISAGTKYHPLVAGSSWLGGVCRKNGTCIWVDNQQGIRYKKWISDANHCTQEVCCVSASIPNDSKNLSFAGWTPIACEQGLALPAICKLQLN